MTKGIEIEDVVLGAGDEALRGKTVIVKLQVFLNHGTELTDKLFPEPKLRSTSVSASLLRVCDVALKVCVRVALGDWS
jgi:hypothetical protein